MQYRIGAAGALFLAFWFAYVGAFTASSTDARGYTSDCPASSWSIVTSDAMDSWSVSRYFDGDETASQATKRAYQRHLDECEDGALQAVIFAVAILAAGVVGAGSLLIRSRSVAATERHTPSSM